MARKSDIADRSRFLVSKYGGIRAASRATGIPKSTLANLVKGSNPSKRSRDRVNRQFRDKAPEEVKERERSGLGTGAALVNEATARMLERSYQISGVPYSVVIHARIWLSRDVRYGGGREMMEYARGSSVDEALANLENNIERLIEKYKVEVEILEISYRVYRK